MLSRLILIVCLAVSANAYAHYPYTYDECNQYSGLIAAITGERDDGQPQEATVKAVGQAIKQILEGDVAFFIKDTGDLSMAFKSIAVVYKHTEMTADELEEASMHDCLTTLVGMKEKTI